MANNSFRKSSTILGTKELQTKTTLRSPSPQSEELLSRKLRINAGEDVKKREPLFTVEGSTIPSSHSSLGTHPETFTPYDRDICTLIFIAALLQQGNETNPIVQTRMTG